MLEVQRLRKSYGTKRVLDALDLNVGPGEIVGLLGPNGTGKSTAMRCFSGVAAPSSGTVRVAGRDPHLDVLVRSKLGYVPDVGGLFPRLSGDEHLDLVARLYSVERKRGVELSEQLALSSHLRERVSSYSHGTGRKLAVVLAMMHEPELVLLDEPFDGVDPLGVRTIRSLITQAADNGASVVVSTHLLDAAAKVCTSLAVLHRGGVLIKGTPAEILQATSTTEMEDAYACLIDGAPLSAQDS